MNLEEQASLVGLILVVVVIVFAIWLTWGEPEKAYVETILMPDGSTQECTFVGYGRTRTLLECEGDE